MRGAGDSDHCGPCHATSPGILHASPARQLQFTRLDSCQPVPTVLLGISGGRAYQRKCADAVCY
jgi:hypothetical protein